MPGNPGGPVVTCSCAFTFCTRGCGCIGRPAFPTPSFFGRNYHAELGRIAPRECGVTPRRHREEPTGRANARPMTGSAMKQSISLCRARNEGLMHGSSKRLAEKLRTFQSVPPRQFDRFGDADPDAGRNFHLAES